ncbi:MAG: hypothetical protein E7641_05520 [Ruminococcaceae bacterium]|nr:hypothetical protein [Oscillospiraceae bacterium]
MNIFGKNLREAIHDGIDEKNELREAFEKITFLNTGIRIIQSDFIKKELQCIIFLHIDWNTLNDELKKKKTGEYGELYLDGEIREQILNCFNEAALRCDLPMIEFSNDDHISVSDYFSRAASIFFDLNIREINKEAKKFFGDVNFDLRFNISKSNYHYYLIFNTDFEKNDAIRLGLDKKIENYVFQLCKEKAPFNIFANHKPLAVVESREKLKKAGEAMGIMRNNPDFDRL